MNVDQATPSSTQMRVLELVKRRGEATADELAVEMETSASAVRQHLSALRAAGLVEARRERGQAGRPAERYHATTATEPLFASTGNALAVELLDQAADEDPDLVDRILRRRGRRLAEADQVEVDGLTFDDKLAAVSRRLDAQGYLADFEKVGEGHYRINLNNCGIWAVAQRYPQACAAELDYVAALLPEAVVERVSHKTAGAHTCGYDIVLRRSRSL